MAISTAALFSTGSEPGRPRHVGQVLALGSSPKRLAQEQNSLVAVDSSQWTSSPITISQPSGSAAGLALPLIRPPSPARRRRGTS